MLNTDESYAMDAMVLDVCLFVDLCGEAEMIIRMRGKVDWTDS